MVFQASFILPCGHFNQVILSTFHDAFWRVECLFLQICEPSRLSNKQKTEEKSEQSQSGEVPDRPVDLQRRVDHEFKSERDERQVQP